MNGDTETESNARSGLALGQLVRLSLAPSALADAAAGIAVGGVAAGGAAWAPGAGPWLGLLAAAGIYHGGMALNDWADRAEDARERPERPIPSGAVSPGLALGVALGLLAVGLTAGFVASGAAGILWACVAGAAVLYDVAGRGPWRGPLLLGACRAGNLGAGLLLGADLAPGVLPDLVWALPLLYGAYVFVVSRLGRFEDGADAIEGRAPSRLLGQAAGLLATAGLAAPLVLHLVRLPAGVAPGWFGPRGLGPVLALVVGLSGARALVRAAGREVWTKRDVLPCMGLCLRRLLLWSAVAALATGTWGGLGVAAATLAGFPLAVRLRRAFPPS